MTAAPPPQPAATPFQANRTLAAALHRPTPVVLRDYEEMMHLIHSYLDELGRTLEALRGLRIAASPHEHADTCEACITIENMRLRYEHDLGLLAAQLTTINDVHQRISRTKQINHATSQDLLLICLITRGVLDNLVRSCALCMNHDIRAYNKHLAESLVSIQKLAWSTLPQSIDENCIPFLDAYRALSGSKRNDSELYADPFQTFARKIEFLKAKSRDEEFNVFFDMLLDLYGSLSDLVHGGIASLAIANPDAPQIVIGRAPLRYTPYAYQVAEFAGISLITSLKTLANLYLPALMQSLSWMEGTSDTTNNLAKTRATLAERIEGATF